MIEIRNVGSFPFGLIQKPNYCIPANVEAVTRYLKPSTSVTQDYLVSRYQSQCGGPLSEISLSKIKACVLDNDPEFRWAQADFVAPERLPTYEAFVAHVKESIRNSLPHIISVPVIWLGALRGWHMLTVVGYDDQNFEAYNSEPGDFLANRANLPFAKLKSDLLSAHPNSEVTDSLVLHPR